MESEEVRMVENNSDDTVRDLDEGHRAYRDASYCVVAIRDRKACLWNCPLI